MKILDILSCDPVKDGAGQPFWEVHERILGDQSPDVDGHAHQFHGTCLEWRIAEYGMDPADVNAVLHLILHEPLLSRRTEVTCYTPGYSPAEALAHRLGQIQGHIDRHEARMTAQHRKLARHAPHQHPVLDPVREQGVREDVLYPRRLLVSGHLAKREGRRADSLAQMREAHALLAQETSRATARPQAGQEEARHAPSAAADRRQRRPGTPAGTPPAPQLE